MADVSVRPARPQDAADIARIQLDTSRAAFAAILAPAVLGAVLDALRPDQATAAWSAAITSAPSPAHHVLVATEQQWLVGFAALGPADDLEESDPEPRTTVAIGPVLVEPRWGRRGHGSRLLAAAVDHARGDAMTRAISWILEGDDVTRTFLESAGWAPDGFARALDTGAGELREVRLHTALLDPA